MEEGYPTNKHPLFKGIKYDYWQERIIAHFESMHIDMWDVVENRDHIPLPSSRRKYERCGETKAYQGGRTPPKRHSKRKKGKEKSSIICYECKKPGHFKSKCPDLETSKDKKKYFKSKDKKGLMNTWDDLNDTSSDEEGEEEANICIMVETTSEESKSDQDDEDFEKICKDHKELEKALHGKVVVSMDESTKDCDACKTLRIKETKLSLENETISKEKTTLLEDFQELENKLKVLQKELNELHSHQKDERYELWRECPQNEKLLKNEALESQPQDVIKLHEEIDSLKTAITKFSKSIDVLDQIVMICREPIDKSRNGYEGDVYNHDKETIVCYFCGKVGHMISKCWDVPKKGKSNAFRTNKKGPKNIWYK
ncbi:hypothetical protein HKD37_17G048653 [Glycine soja]